MPIEYSDERRQKQAQRSGQSPIAFVFLLFARFFLLSHIWPCVIRIYVVGVLCRVGLNDAEWMLYTRGGQGGWIAGARLRDGVSLTVMCNTRLKARARFT